MMSLEEILAMVKQGQFNEEIRLALEAHTKSVMKTNPDDDMNLSKAKASSNNEQSSITARLNHKPALVDMVNAFEAIENLTHQAKRQIASELQYGTQAKAEQIFVQYQTALNTRLAIIRGKLVVEQGSVASTNG